MLQESFIFLPGIREKTERKLWEAGITTWEKLLQAEQVPGVSTSRLHFWKAVLRDLHEESLPKKLRPRDVWRSHDHIMDNPRYIDIETTEYGEITVLGVSDGEFYQGFVRGRNLDRQAIKKVFDGDKTNATTILIDDKRHM